MKKTLLSLLVLASISFAAKADEVAVVFAGFEYNAPEGTEVVEFPDGSTTTPINEKDFNVPGVCTFAFYKNIASTGDTYINPSGQTPHLQWAKQTLLYIVPAEGVTLTKITFACTTTKYTGNLKLDWGEGECSVDGLNSYWEGSQKSDFGFVFENGTQPMRFSYMLIEYTKGTSAIEAIEADNNAPVEYFNLLGVKVNDLKSGNIYIRRQGNTATKVIR